MSSGGYWSDNYWNEDHFADDYWAEFEDPNVIINPLPLIITINQVAPTIPTKVQAGDSLSLKIDALDRDYDHPTAIRKFVFPASGNEPIEPD